MKVFIVYIVFIAVSTPLLGQGDTIVLDPVDFSKSTSTNYIEEFDLTEHWYWKNYLLSFGKESIKLDSSICEAYRLIYWGNYFSIVEVVRRDSFYIISADSSAWGLRFGFVDRFQDTIAGNSALLQINHYCNTNKNLKRIKEAEEGPDDLVLDDRDNWAFEYKIDTTYRSIDGIDTPIELAIIYNKMMELGDLNDYRIWIKGGGYQDY